MHPPIAGDRPKPVSTLSMKGTAQRRAAAGLALFVSAALAGCGAYVPRWPPPPDASPAYRAGYTDGCFTGTEKGTLDPYPRVRKDEARFQNDAEYREGWEKGVQLCYERSRDRLRTLDCLGCAQ